LARSGVEIAVRVLIDEPTSAPPTGTLSIAPSDASDDTGEGEGEGETAAPAADARPLDVDESATGPGNQDFTLRYRVRGDEPEGLDVPITVRVVDSVGLASEATIAVRFDFDAPPAPLTVSDDGGEAIVLFVAPGGAHDEFDAVHAVRAPAGALAPDATLVLRTTPDGLPFAEVEAAADGSAAADVPEDALDVWASQRDAAGNESAPARIEEVVFVSTTSPFDFNDPKAALELAPLADLGPLARGRQTLPFAGVESRGPMTAARLDLEAPPALIDTAMVADPTRGEILLIGGMVAETGEIVGDAFAWNGDAWVPRFLDAPPRSGHALAFDPTRGTITLVGGAFGFNTTPKPETWRKDDALFALEESNIVGIQDNTAFELRCEHHGAVFDPARPGVLLVHGCPQGDHLPFGQWEREDGAWRIVAEPADPEGDGNPRALESPSIVADVPRGRVVLYGGLEQDGSDGIAHGETWEWDGASWTLTVPADPDGVAAPSPRSAAFSAWDAKHGRVLVGGGFRRIDNVTIDFKHDLWAYDANGWTRLPDFPGPDRVNAVAAFDARRAQLVVFGGVSFGDDARSTLLYQVEDIGDDLQEGGWRLQAAREATPPASQGGSMTAVSGRLALYGGTGFDVDASVWTFDGAWRELGAFDTSFSPRVDGKLLVRGANLLLLGGESSSTTSDDVVRITLNTPPTITTVANLPPGTSRWSDFGAAVHPATGIVAVAGGYRYEGFDAVKENGALFLDGTTWTRGADVLTDADQSFSAHVVYDAPAGQFLFYSRCVASGGSDCSTRTLAFPADADRSFLATIDEAVWTPLADSAERPQTRGGAALIFDTSAQAPILVGGDASEAEDGFTDEAYVWRQDRWVTVPILDAEGDGPLPRLLGAAFAYDPTRARTVLFGGSQGYSVPFARTFAVDALAQERPAVVATFDPATAGIDPTEGDGVTAVALHLYGVAGASANGVHGFSVRVWDRVRWVEVGASEAPSSEPAAFELDVPDDLAARALVRGRLPIQIVPAGENGTDRARVVVTALEARLRLRR
jgi:hypothetical protein